MATEGRPTVTAAVLGDVLANLAPRLRRRLDADPTMAEAWHWQTNGDSLTVSSDDAVVSLDAEAGSVSASTGAACSCLLAPACLHIAAVLSVLEVTTAQPAGPGGEPSAEADVLTPPGATTTDRPSTAAMQAAAAGLAVAVGRILEVGAGSAGLIVRGEVLRAVHGCGVIGLHRLAGAGLRVAQGLARLQADDPEFRLGELRNDIAEALRIARRIARGDASAEVVGTARRAYEPVGALRLYGLFTEPIVSRSGYAGVVTYLVDRDQRIWALSDVVPAEPARALEAYANGAGLGDASLSHRAAGRSGLLIGDARVSHDGRLGRGQQVRAVAATGGSWSEAPIDSLFAVPLPDQLARAWGAFDESAAERRQGDTFIFATATVAGARDGTLAVWIDGLAFRCVPPSDHVDLGYRDNLTILSGSAGTRLRIAARPLPDRPGTLELVAIGEISEGGLSLPRTWAGRANLGLDRLVRSHATAGDVVAVPPVLRASPDVLDPLARHLDRMVIGGRLTMGPAARAAIDRDIVGLRRRHLVTGGAVLGALADVAAARSDAAALAEGWLAAVTYERAAHRRVAATRWLSGAGSGT